MSEVTNTFTENLRAAWHRGASRTSWRSIFLLWLPASLVAAAVLLPTIYLGIRVFGAEKSISELLFRPAIFEILVNTLVLTGGVTLLSTVISVPLAWLTVRTDLPYRKFWAILAALPLVIPSYVAAYLLVSALGPLGMLHDGLAALFGIERLPSIYGFPGALLTLTLISYPYVYLSVRAALGGMDPSIEEAARSLGYGPGRTFLRVTLPQLKPAMASGGLLVGLYVLRDFGAVSVMRYTTFTRAIFVQYGSAFDRSGAAALALVLIIITLFILAVDTRLRANARTYSSTTHTRPAAVQKLGRWKWPALLFCALIVGLGVAIPAGVLVFWLLRGIQAGEQISALGPALINSLTGSLLAAAVALVAALPIAVLAVRRPGKMSTIIDRMTYIGFALPGVAIALALVFFGANYALIFYQTLPMLVFAYLILFLPQAVGAAKTSLMQVHPNLEEAGRSLGKQPLLVFWRITLPLVRPGLGTGAALVFLTAMKELPATLILGPFGFKTLATSVWSAVSEAFFAEAAAPALLLILASSIPMAFLVLRQRL